MKTEIRKDVRDYILEQVSESLARLGVSEKVVEIEARERDGRIWYNFRTAPIKQMPVLFKELVVCGEMVVALVKEDDYLYPATEKNDVVVVDIEYRWKTFRRGENGTELGRMIFLVKKELPESFYSKHFGSVASSYIDKFKGLEI